MIGIDTNLLIRYIVQDDPIQSKIADNVLEKTISSDNPGFINQIVLCEVAWVLKRSYGYRKERVVGTLKKLIDSRELVFENADCARLAVTAFADGNADFSDYFIGFINKENGCDYTITLDRSASTGTNFRQAK